ncbi:MAG: hypothetical protein II557_02650, partial [Clostridia bacterium]|nr:hypothetical protein [Clostridia bacterium]
MYKVAKRNGKLVSFSLDKIKTAILSAFEACERNY